MRALTIRDGKLVVEERPDPVPGSTEVLVAVAAAGLNAADLLQRRGLYPAPAGSPQDIPGLELAGEVVGLGSSVTRWNLGDRVMAVVAGGAQAELCVVDENHLLPVPATMDPVEAGGFPEAFSTAFDAMVTQGRLSVGDRLLVTGAAGGVGTAAVQLGRAIGAVVVASARDTGRHAALSDLGADVVITPDEVANHGPYDVVLELVGAASLTNGVLSTLATGARVVVIGVGGGATMEINLLGLMGARASIGGSTLRARSRTEKAMVAEAVTAHVLPLVDRGDIGVPILATYDLEQAEAAYERFGAGAKLGKIVLTF
jgi:NADPH:quinone reductase-like Zn-dependent oxidoreductase